MGRGTHGVLAAPVQDDGAAAATDHRLVARVRRGEDRAFELLYQRYHRRIHAYVLGMVKDHGRAEDVTQEVFVSALRRMRATERPIAFKPWIYEIAKNACIDAFRRSKRAEEVSYDADDGLTPGDHSRLVGAGPSPDAALDAKQDLESLWGAFGGLSETHHEILVLRELEGLSYSEIGRRMGMSRPAVESTLFRARRRLTEEYDDIVSGARCLRIQAIIQIAVSSRLGARDTRRLARHLAHCQPCRREAMEAGLDRALIARPPVRQRIASRVAGLLPFPAFGWLRRGDPAAGGDAGGGGRGAGFVSHLPLLSDQLSGGWGKLAAGGALLVAGVGAGVGVHHATATPAPPAASSRPALTADHPARTAVRHAARAAAATPAATPRHARSTAAHRRSSARHAAAAAKRSHASPPAASRTVSTSAGSGTSATPASTASAGTRSGAGSTAGATTRAAGNAVRQTAGTAGGAVQQVTTTVGSTVDGVTGAVDGAVTGVTGAVDGAAASGPAAGAVQQATGAVNQTAGAVTGTVRAATDDATNTVGQVAGALTGSNPTP